MDKLEEDDNRLELWLRYPNRLSRFKLLFVTLQLIISLKKMN